MTQMQSHIHATGEIALVERISQEHEQLRIVLGMAERCAANADRGHCQQVLRWALQFLEQHSRSEESLLARCAYRGIHGVRRDHERLIVAVEQALAALDEDDVADVADMLRRVGQFLASNVARDAQSMQRFFFQILPCRVPAGTH